MEIIATAHNNGFVFDNSIKLEEGKEYKIVIKEKKAIDPKVLAITGILTTEKIDDLKEYLSANKRLDYENIR